jgi:hypothetical protein
MAAPIPEIMDVSLYSMMVEKTEGKRRLGIPRLRWEDNIKMDFKRHRMV